MNGDSASYCSKVNWQLGLLVNSLVTLVTYSRFILVILVILVVSSSPDTIVESKWSPIHVIYPGVVGFQEIFLLYSLLFTGRKNLRHVKCCDQLKISKNMRL